MQSSLFLGNFEWAPYRKLLNILQGGTAADLLDFLADHFHLFVEFYPL